MSGQIAKSCAVKICGLSGVDDIKAAAKAGARYLGFVFVPASPRNIGVGIAKDLSLSVPTGVKAVGLFVNPIDEDLDKILPYVMLDYIQLHGDETPQRVLEIKQKYMLPVMKALPVKSIDDLDNASNYAGAADMLLLDAKAQDGSFGGSGESFDWDMLREFKAPCPWLLAGGLSPNNVRAALDICGSLPHFLGVDVSSGVEKQRGMKDAQLINEFLNEVKAWQNAEK